MTAPIFKTHELIVIIRFQHTSAPFFTRNKFRVHCSSVSASEYSNRVFSARLAALMTTAIDATCRLQYEVSVGIGKVSDELSSVLQSVSERRHCVVAAISTAATRAG